MIETEQSIVIDAAIDNVWDYVQDIGRWANLFPGCQECTVIDTHDSRWTLKVGAGGLVRTVKVMVHVDQWGGPERVDFSYRLEAEPVVGSGSYIASRKGERETEVALKVRVEGSGPMAAMWEAVIRPLLPTMAKSFAGKLKREVEEAVGVPASQAATPSEKPSLLAAIVNWLRKLRQALFGSQPRLNPQQGEIVMSEQNKAVALKFLEAMGSNDGATAASCLSPDAFTLVKGFGKFTGVRHYDTIVGTIEAFKKLVPTGLRPDVKTVTAEGDRVVIEFEGNATTCDGKPYNNQYCMVFTLADGKIKQVNEYFCTILAEEVLWPLVEQMADEIPAS